VNNVWNKDVSGPELQQEIFVEDLGGKPTFGWRWRAPWQTWSSVASFPELICGAKPWGKPYLAISGLPFHPGARRLSADYTLRLEATGSYDMSFSMWVVDNLPAKPSAIRCAVEVWVASRKRRPAGTLSATVMVQGQPFDLYIDRHRRDESGNYKNEWTGAVFVSRTPLLHGPLDLGAFLDQLLQLKILTSDWWVADVELGTGISQGVGIAEVQDFALKVE
jgi:hypothetical protein